MDFLVEVVHRYIGLSAGPFAEFVCHQILYLGFSLVVDIGGRASPPHFTSLRWLSQDGGLVEGTHVSEIVGTN